MACESEGSWRAISSPRAGRPQAEDVRAQSRALACSSRSHRFLPFLRGWSVAGSRGTPRGRGAEVHLGAMASEMVRSLVLVGIASLIVACGKSTRDDHSSGSGGAEIGGVGGTGGRGGANSGGGTGGRGGANSGGGMGGRDGTGGRAGADAGAGMDAGAASAGMDAGPDAAVTACGSDGRSCVEGEVCVERHSATGVSSFSCEEITDECRTNPRCSCLASELCAPPQACVDGAGGSSTIFCDECPFC